MSFFVQGTIKSAQRVRHQNQECYGLMRGWKNKFSIRISDKAIEDGQMYAETVLHELFHLYFWMLIARGVKRLTEKRQHEIIEQAIPVVLSRVANVLKRSRK